MICCRQILNPLKTSRHQHSLLQCLEATFLEEIRVDFILVLKQCSKTRDLVIGQKIQERIREQGAYSDIILANTLLNMYNKCGSMRLAREAFDTMAYKDTVTWTTLIQGYVENGESSAALDMFERMNCEPSHVTYVAALKACMSLAAEGNSDLEGVLERGSQIHRKIRESALESNVLVASSLVNMYSKCGSMQLAMQVFENMARRDTVVWTCLISGYVENGEPEQALQMFERMDTLPDNVTYVAALKACLGLPRETPLEREAMLQRCTAIHRQLRDRGFESNMSVASTLVDMYSKLGNIALAREVFDRMSRKDTVTWTCLILGYVENGESSTALDLFQAMDCEPSQVTYVAALKACASLAGVTDAKRLTVLDIGLELHEQVKRRGFESNILVANTLARMYCRCGDMRRAVEVFDGTICKDVVTWNAVILGYIENGESLQALKLFSSMDCEPSHVTYVAALKACAALVSDRRTPSEEVLDKGISVHEQVKLRGLESNISVASALMSMYSKLGDMKSAREVFDKLPARDAVAWTCLILGYVENGESSVALDVFDSMDCEPDEVMYLAVLKGCAALATEKRSEREAILEKGLRVHDRLKELGYEERNISLASALVDMYSKCGKMQYARDVFERMSRKDVVTWTCLIFGYVENGQSSTALELFNGMDCEQNAATFVSALKACTSLASRNDAEKPGCLVKGIAIHERIKQRQLESNVVVANSLINLYAKLGDMHSARDVFERLSERDNVTWGCLLLGYVENGEAEVALDLFGSVDTEQSPVTFIATLKACTWLASCKDSDKSTVLEKGIRIHEQLKGHSFEWETSLANTLINMYRKCGNMTLAREVFKRMTFKDGVTWSNLIMGYVENNDSSQALELFAGMDCPPNHVTFVAALRACGSASALQLGRSIHGTVCKFGLEEDPLTATTLVDFYGRCGCMGVATQLFNSMHCADIASWNALVSGYSSRGEASLVFDLMKQLQDAGLQPDGITFVCILTACSHAGMVEAAKTSLDAMHKYKVKPTVEHYTCMVDVLGRANRLDEALVMIEKMPFKANEATWTTLLGSCRKWNNLTAARVAFDALESRKSPVAAYAYVVMRDICGTLGVLQDEKLELALQTNTSHKRKNPCTRTTS